MAGALEGIKILEFTRVAPGSFLTMMLADMGAEVIKVETPPDAQTKKGTGSGISPDASQAKRAAFNFTNRNKKSIALNLKVAEGQRVLQDLAKGADVLVEGFRPGVMKRLGADYETLSTLNPRLVYCSLSGYGKEGPYKDLPGHDICYLSFGGTLSMMPPAGQLPAIPLNLVADYAAATLHGVIGVLLALMARQQTGRGQLVDISYLDGVISLTAAVPGLWQYFMGEALPKRGESSLAGVYPYYNVYECKDGKMISLGCTEIHFWQNFCGAIGREDLSGYHFQPEHFLQGPDEKTRAVVEEVRGIFKTQTRDEWFAQLREYDICVGKVNTWDEVCEDPQVRQRDMIVDVDDPVAGKVRQVGVAIKLSDTPGSIRTLGPYMGQHTAELLSALGYAAAEIARLKEQGIVL